MQTRQMEPPAIVGIMGRVWMWLAWLTAGSGVYFAVVGYRWQWNPPFLLMMGVVGLMAAKRESTETVLWTAIVVLTGVGSMLVLK